MVKNLSGNNFKYLSQEFSGDLLELVKQKGVYPHEYMESFEKFSEDKLPDRSKFFNSVKNKPITYLRKKIFDIYKCFDYV